MNNYEKLDQIASDILDEAAMQKGEEREKSVELALKVCKASAENRRLDVESDLKCKDQYLKEKEVQNQAFEAQAAAEERKIDRAIGIGGKIVSGLSQFAGGTALVAFVMYFEEHSIVATMAGKNVINSVFKKILK